jgi:hypothetical protein
MTLPVGSLWPMVVTVQPSIQNLCAWEEIPWISDSHSFLKDLLVRMASHKIGRGKGCTFYMSIHILLGHVWWPNESQSGRTKEEEASLPVPVDQTELLKGRGWYCCVL